MRGAVIHAVLIGHTSQSCGYTTLHMKHCADLCQLAEGVSAEMVSLLTPSAVVTGGIQSTLVQVFDALSQILIL